MPELHHLAKIGMGRRWNTEKKAAGRHKTGDVVDMAIGFYIGKFTGEPEDRFGTGIVAKNFGNLVSRAVRVSIVVQQTLFRRDKRAIAIDMDRATLAYDRCRKLYGACALQNSAGERGIIVCTASVAAYDGQIGQAAYSSSKGGVVALVLPAAREFAQFGIRVNAIAPGIFLTPMLMGLSQAAQDSLAASLPFPKKLGDPAQFASLVREMIQNRYLNGEVVRLDAALRMAPR